MRLASWWASDPQPKVDATCWHKGPCRAHLVDSGAKLCVYLLPEPPGTQVSDWLAFWAALQHEASAQGHPCFQATLPPQPSLGLLLSLKEAGLSPSAPGVWWWEGRPESAITFKAFALSDIPQILAWFETEDVKKYYAVHSYTSEEITDRFASQLNYPDIQGFVVHHEGLPVGYIQHSPLKAYPWNNQGFPESVVQQALCLEMFLGDPQGLAQGLGSRMLQAFLKQHVWPTHAFAAVDPWFENQRAITFYERNGFAKHKIVEALFSEKPNVPVQLMLASRPVAWPLSEAGLQVVNAATWQEHGSALEQAMHPLNVTAHHAPGIDGYVRLSLARACSEPDRHQMWWLCGSEHALGVVWLQQDAYQNSAVLGFFAVPSGTARMFEAIKKVIAAAQKQGVKHVFVGHVGPCTREEAEAYENVLGAQCSGSAPLIAQGMVPPNDGLFWWHVSVAETSSL